MFLAFLGSSCQERRNLTISLFTAESLPKGDSRPPELMSRCNRMECPRAKEKGPAGYSLGNRFKGQKTSRSSKFYDSAINSGRLLLFSSCASSVLKCFGRSHVLTAFKLLVFAPCVSACFMFTAGSKPCGRPFVTIRSRRFRSG